jgi:hypothetical protein
MEHAVPEQFWVDKSQCRYADESGTIKNPTQADCAQAVSAVKAIAIAQAEGQRIYTINQSNAATALPKLPLGGTVGAEIRSAIQAGKEVTFHERGINAHGFSGTGYIITDPETGAGAYMIEGRGNGGALIYGIAAFVFAIAALFILAWLGPFAILGYGWMLMLSFASAGAYLDAIGAQVNWSAISNWIGLTLAVIGLAAAIPALGVLLVGNVAIVAGIIGLISAIYSVLS